MYSKIERGERKAKRSQIPIMAKLFEVDEKGERTFSVMPEQLMMKYICLEGHLQHDEDISDANSSKIVDPGSEGIEGESNRRGFYR